MIVITRPKKRTIPPDEDSQIRAQRNAQLRQAEAELPRLRGPKDYDGLREGYTPIGFADYILEQEGRLTRRLIGDDRCIFVDGKYSHPLERIREANRELKRRGLAQIADDPRWRV